MDDQYSNILAKASVDDHFDWLYILMEILVNLLYKVCNNFATALYFLFL